MKDDTLAIDGGRPVRAKPMPHRGLIGKAERAAALRVIDRSIRTGDAFGYNGPFEQKYERDFARFMGGGYADAVNSGTNAVYCALGALQLDAMSEVIVPPITDPGGAMPVALLNCIPVFADAAPGTFNTSAQAIEPLINRRTRAVIVAHIAGEPADMDPIMRLARKHRLWVIEDCAQAHGAKYNGRMVGTIGQLAVFSTMFGKHHCTGGQGGVVYTRDEQLYWRARRFADRGKPFNLAPETGNVVAGLNCNLNDLSAAIGSAQLRKLPRIIEKRHRLGERIKRELARRCRAVSLGRQVPHTKCVYWFLRVALDLQRLRVGKVAFCKALAAEGLPVGDDYRAIQCERPWFMNKAIFGKSGFPWRCSDYKGPKNPHYTLTNAIDAAETQFTIGLHEAYGEREIRDIVRALEKVERAYLK